MPYIYTGLRLAAHPSFNSLFEMHYLNRNKFKTRLKFLVSIPYLRCLRAGDPVVYVTTERFNSLFEMREAGRGRG